MSGWSGVSETHLLIQKAPFWSDQDRFDAAYEAFRDLSEGLYDIDTRQYARGVTSDDAPGIILRWEGNPDSHALDIDRG